MGSSLDRTSMASKIRVFRPITTEKSNLGGTGTYYAANTTKPIGDSTKRNQNTAIGASFFIVVVVVTTR